MVNFFCARELKHESRLVNRKQQQMQPTPLTRRSQVGRRLPSWKGSPPPDPTAGRINQHQQCCDMPMSLLAPAQAVIRAAPVSCKSCARSTANAQASHTQRKTCDFPRGTIGKLAEERTRTSPRTLVVLTGDSDASGCTTRKWSAARVEANK